ncbi:uncharacterized protein WCC33_000659 [Rhinophrynus dorsalis]
MVVTAHECTVSWDFVTPLQVDFTMAVYLVLSSTLSCRLAPAQCDIAPKSRINCGPPGITPADCNSRGCCFDSSIANVIWCFYPLPENVRSTSRLKAAMASKISLFLVSVLALSHQCSAKESSSSSSEEEYPINKDECNVAPYLRRDCGYPGISSAECSKRNCCFDSSTPGVNWCFFSKAQDKDQCSIDTEKRKDCGYPGISSKECYSRGCCFDSSVSGVNWCFYPKFKGCSVSHKLRKDCGYSNISSKDCYSKGCCYDSSIPETVWCFFGGK